jgi:peptidoglycan/LPS O-acetylase OafA/YrhL
MDRSGLAANRLTSDSRVEPDRRNNFDAVRLVAAITVVVGHSWPLTGIEHPPTIAGIKVYTLAVYVFFSVSGYLIAQSWARGPAVVSFLANRALRIFPALVVVILVTTFAIGPLVSSMGPVGYFASPETYHYLANLTLSAVYELPGVFEGNPTSAVNGALWTLGPEFVCYLSVLVVGVVLARRRMFGAGLVTLVLLCLGLLSIEPLRSIAVAAVFFGCGYLIAVTSRGRRLRLTPVAVAIPVWLVAASVFPSIRLELAWLVLPYSVIAIGQRSTPLVRRAGRFGDFSYGMYLWGFPIQQLIVAGLPGISLFANVLMVVAVTAIAAVASWHLVEKRFLLLKSRFRPRRRESASIGLTAGTAG